MHSSQSTIRIRTATANDLIAVTGLDGKITGLAKPDYWRDLIRRFGGRKQDRYFLIAEAGTELLGFIMGEIRAWEFGSPPCGWIFAVNVEPDKRLTGVGTVLFEALCGKFRENGVATVRTMLARDDTLIMSFFRSQGMMAGPYIELEAALD
ncbi:MAG: GNAT family N-acetyltransferase [Alphaproteobacteria bacterium]|nr:GNAT family N-acetyltransferase [Alphaproteobacteria bacterium]